MSRILCICLSSTIQRSVAFDGLALTKVNRSNHYSQYASGKAINSARVLNQLEKGCSLSICPAGEENLDLFLTLAAKDDLEIQTVPIPGFTRECWTLLDSKTNTTTELVVSEPALNLEAGTNLSVAESADLENQLFTLIESELPNVDAVLLAGSKPAIWSKDVYPKIAEMVMANGKTFLADYWAEDLINTLKVTVPSIIKINDEEFCKTFGLTFGEGPEYEKELKSAICKKAEELKRIAKQEQEQVEITNEIFEKKVFDILDLQSFKLFLKESGIVFYIKLHPKSKNYTKYKEFVDDNFILLDKASDTYSYLRLSDLLITDYSSIYFDYLVTEKPIVFFAYDLEEYLMNSRELYFDYDKVTPGKKVVTMEELITAIRDILLSNKDDYVKKRKNIKKWFFNGVDILGCEQLVSTIVMLTNK